MHLDWMLAHSSHLNQLLFYISYYKYFIVITRWFKYDRDYLCANKSQFVPVILEPPRIIFQAHILISFNAMTF
jgi:hypothetical protein